MSKFKGEDAARLGDPDSWDDDDIIYLRDRGMLPEGYRVPKRLASRPPQGLALEDYPNTGDVGTIADNPVNLAGPGTPVGQFVDDEEDDGEESFSDMTKDQLQQEARSRGIDDSGTKADIIARLEEFEGSNA